MKAVLTCILLVLSVAVIGQVAGASWFVQDFESLKTGRYEALTYPTTDGILVTITGPSGFAIVNAPGGPQFRTRSLAANKGPVAIVPSDRVRGLSVNLWTVCGEPAPSITCYADEIEESIQFSVRGSDGCNQWTSISAGNTLYDEPPVNHCVLTGGQLDDLVLEP